MKQLISVYTYLVLMENSINLFSVDYFDPKTSSFKFGKNVFITFEMPKYPTKDPC